jgi:hypothetical protein
MKDRIEEMILHLSQKTLAVMFGIFGTITFVDAVDFSVRTLTGLVALGIASLAWKNYRLKNKLLEKEIELKDQELEEILLKKKK